MLMHRIPEPELMNDPAQAKAYAEADFSAPHNHCIDLLLEHHPDLSGHGLAIDLGCGNADITIRFLHRCPQWQVQAVDAAAAMLAQAKQGLQKTPYISQVELLHSDIGNVDFSSCNLLFSNSLLHHLQKPQHLWQCIHRCQAGTMIFIMDLLRPTATDEVQMLVQTYAAGEPAILQRDFHNSLQAAYTVTEVKEQLHSAQLPQLQVKQVSDRHLIVSGRVN